MQVLKIGGNEIDDKTAIKKLGLILATLPLPFILVHGGGKEIKQLQKQLGLTPQYIDGLRVTDEESLSLVKMVLAGRINKRLVAAFSNAGVDAFGMSGVDRASIQAKKLHHPQGDLGYVGEITNVKTTVFKQLLDHNIVPVISPICYGLGGEIFNVNADHVAVALAIALKATQLTFISNVPGVLQDDQLLAQLTPAQIETLITQGIIHSGMIPKINSALHGVQSGIPSVRITDLNGLKSNTGTIIVKNELATVHFG